MNTASCRRRGNLDSRNSGYSNRIDNFYVGNWVYSIIFYGKEKIAQINFPNYLKSRDLNFQAFFQKIWLSLFNSITLL